MAAEKGNKKSAKSVSRKTLIGMRADRKLDFDMRAWKQRHDHRQFIMSRSSKETADLRKRYEQEEMVESQATVLYEQYKDAGASWASCVQAVKTDWVSNFHAKWAPKLREVRENQKLMSNVAAKPQPKKAKKGQ
jgi:hypothetical protein